MRQDEIGYTGIPFDQVGTPVLDKVRSLVVQDVAVTEGARMRGFSDRQTAMSFRQPVKITRSPEVDVGALMDLGS